MTGVCGWGSAAVAGADSTLEGEELSAMVLGLRQRSKQATKGRRSQCVRADCPFALRIIGFKMIAGGLVTEVPRRRLTVP